MRAELTLRRIAAERILVLDGAMGTMIQALKLDEEGYRGARFDAWNREVRGNNDLLNLTRPDAIRAIHLAYYRAGADIGGDRGGAIGRAHGAGNEAWTSIFASRQSCGLLGELGTNDVELGDQPLHAVIGLRDPRR